MFTQDMRANNITVSSESPCTVAVMMQNDRRNKNK